MAENAPKPQGTPCWIDMTAEPQQAGIDFYRTLLGWTGEPGPAEMGGYAVMSAGGAPVAGIMGPMPDQPQGPSAWTVYFAVDDVAAVAKKADALGGRVFMGPMEVPETGIMALAQDPTGAVFGLWQARPFTGMTATGDGAPCWFELEGTDAQRSAEFYAALFGAESAELEQMPGQYWLLKVKGREVAGVWKAGEERGGGTPRWQVYFQVVDADAATATVTTKKGKVLREPADSPYGRYSVVADPFGAQFALLTPSAAG
jgi:predicted enzyme related to lactoylglutathione lyase